jgi:hypothetical protein
MLQAILAVTTVFMILLGFMFHKFTTEVEKRVAFQVSAQTAELSLQYKDDTAKMSQELADLKAQNTVAIAKAQGAYTQEINAMRSTYERDIREKPFNTGDFYERRLATIMCQIASDSDEDYKACSIQASQPYSPNQSIVVTVTAETAEQWSEQCEDGDANVCGYAIVGFTTQGALTFMDYFNQVQSYIQEMKNAREYDGKVIDALVDGFEKNFENDPK